MKTHIYHLYCYRVENFMEVIVMGRQKVTKWYVFVTPLIWHQVREILESLSISTTSNKKIYSHNKHT